jgi:hypothetical protein
MQLPSAESAIRSHRQEHPIEPGPPNACPGIAAESYTVPQQRGLLFSAIRPAATFTSDTTTTSYLAALDMDVLAT